MASDVDSLSAQLEQHLTSYHQRQVELDGRLQQIDSKHAELHRYTAKIVDFEQFLDRKVERSTRAIEGLAISYGKQIDGLDDVRGEVKQLKIVLMKMGKKLGLL